MLRMRAGGGWRWEGSGNLEWVRRGRALGEEVASVEHGRTHNCHGNRFDLSLCGCQACSAHGDWVDRLCWWPEVGRWAGRGGGRLDQRQWSVPPISALSLPLSPPPTLPSADPKSRFDWISHELMRQAWRTASVVEISYHILIRPLCECVCLCDLMGFFNEIKE